MGQEDLAMTTAGFGQMLAFLALLALIAKPLGAYVADIFVQPHRKIPGDHPLIGYCRKPGTEAQDCIDDWNDADQRAFVCGTADWDCLPDYGVDVSSRVLAGSGRGALPHELAQ
jgi:hypothetical protein